MAKHALKDQSTNQECASKNHFQNSRKPGIPVFLSPATTIFFLFFFFNLCQRRREQLGEQETLHGVGSKARQEPILLLLLGVVVIRNIAILAVLIFLDLAFSVVEPIHGECMQGWRGFGACRERENGVIVFIERDSEKTRDRKRLRYCLGKSSMPLTSFAFCSVKIKYNLNKECNKYRKGQIKKEWRFLFGQN